MPARENSMRSRFDSVVTVPTVDRDVAVDCRYRHHAVEPAAHAVLPRRHISAGSHRATGFRRVL
ncbi:hypothetical protein C6A85_07325, partial [Mycobacterium sp. ITM-2017-0098]